MVGDSCLSKNVGGRKGERKKQQRPSGQAAQGRGGKRNEELVRIKRLSIIFTAMIHLG